MSEEIMAAGAGKPARTLEMVTAEIRYLDAQAGRLVMGHALEIGKRLTEAKALVAHGEWGSYLETELHYTQTTANKLMKVFDEYGASQIGLFGPEVNSETFTNLTYSKALALLSVPREEREAFAQAVDAEHLSTRELQQAIRERDEARKAAKVLQLEKEDLDKGLSRANAESLKKSFEIQDLKKKIEEIESRPIDVAVQEPDPAEVEKRAAELAKEARDEAAAANQVKDAMKASLEAAEKKAAADLEAAKKSADEKIEKLKKKVQDAQNKLERDLVAARNEGKDETAQFKAEADKLRAETEQLRKQLAMSNQATVVFKLRFMAWQQAHQQMSEAFTALDEETKEKMRAAIRAQVKHWGWAE